MSDDLVWFVVIVMAIIGIIFAIFGIVTLHEITETPYDKCIDSCYFHPGRGVQNLELKAECLERCQLLVNCEVAT